MLALVEMVTAKIKKCSAEVVLCRAVGLTCAKLILRRPQTLGKTASRRVFSGIDELLHRARITEMCFREDFPYKQRFIERGYKEQDRTALLAAKAGEITAAGAKEGDVAFIFSLKLTSDVLRAAEILSTSFRYMTADIPPHCWSALCTSVERFGLSPKSLGSTGEAEVSAAVFFDVPQRHIFLPGKCRTLFVRERRPITVAGGRETRSIKFSIPEKMKDSFPPGYQADRLLSYAIAAGVISARDIEVM